MSIAVLDISKNSTRNAKCAKHQWIVRRIPMTRQVECNNCGCRFAITSREYYSGNIVCPQCKSTGKKDKDGRLIYCQQ